MFLADRYRQRNRGSKEYDRELITLGGFGLNMPGSATTYTRRINCIWQRQICSRFSRVRPNECGALFFRFDDSFNFSNCVELSHVFGAFKKMHHTNYDQICDIYESDANGTGVALASSCGMAQLGPPRRWWSVYGAHTAPISRPIFPRLVTPS